MKPRPSQALVLLLLAPGSPAFAESPSCFLFPSNAEDYTCTCGPGPYPDADGPFNDVGGSGPYAVDSDICRAAVHAGVLGPEGGEVTAIRTEPPEGEWRGSMANGVMTDNVVTMASQPGDSAFTFEGAAPAPEPLPEAGIPAGSQGAIIFVFATPYEAYEVEFLDSDGRQTAQVTLRPSQFRVS